VGNKHGKRLHNATVLTMWLSNECHNKLSATRKASVRFSSFPNHERTVKTMPKSEQYAHWYCTYQHTNPTSTFNISTVNLLLKNWLLIVNVTLCIHAISASNSKCLLGRFATTNDSYFVKKHTTMLKSPATLSHYYYVHEKCTLKPMSVISNNTKIII